MSDLLDLKSPRTKRAQLERSWPCPGHGVIDQPSVALLPAYYYSNNSVHNDRNKLGEEKDTIRFMGRATARVRIIDTLRKGIHTDMHEPT